MSSLLTFVTQSRIRELEEEGSNDAEKVMLYLFILRFLFVLGAGGVGIHYKQGQSCYVR